MFVIGAMMASVAGSLYATFLEFIDPSVAMLKESIFIFVIVILGGLANLYGSILGASFLILLPEALRFIGMPDNMAGYIRQIIYGLILIYLMLFRPQGFIGKYKP
ncbi:MAG TPA: hypothetical protein ENG83_08990 [Nitrospirae bacterium]|nr:hypothetical protein [Nitrospirota bacterium]HDZ00816.1 hypothetical protein [Nitrospirota bacterium]